MCSKRANPLGALNRVALRSDALVLARHYISMVQHVRFPERDPMSAKSGLGQTQRCDLLVPHARCTPKSGRRQAAPSTTTCLRR